MPNQPIAVLTRPAGLNAQLEQALTQLGWAVRAAPALQITHRALGEGERLPNPADFDLVVFVSGNAVAGYASQWAGSVPWPVSTMAACVGLTTAQHVREAFGASVQVLHPAVNDIQDSESLWRVITARGTMPERVLVLRGQDGRDWLADQFVSEGVSVQIHVVYCRELATWSPALNTQFLKWADDQTSVVWLLTSPHGIESVLQQIEQAGLSSWALSCRYIVTHPRLVDELRKGLARLVKTTAAIKPAENQIEAQIEVSRGDLPSLVSSFEKIRQNSHQN